MCAVAGTLILTAAGTASGAQGFLVINGTEHENPTGCIAVHDRPARFHLVNDTDSPAVVFIHADCRGGITEEVDPGADIDAYGSSVRIE
ncbi:hypothetical protein IU441_21315 [Nocardia cyriacigeorgica]|nr:hypothetical protein [Nocardia cyriacigeorgica]